MSNLISDIRAKARKPHTCFLCGRTIPVGEIHRCYTFADGGDMFRNREHLRCLSLMHELDAAGYMDEGEYTDDDFETAVVDLCREVVCPQCQHYDKTARACGNGDVYPTIDCWETIWDFAKSHTYQQGVGWVEKQDDVGKGSQA